MTRTPPEMRDRVRRYYQETTQRCYLQRWGTTSLALHLGLDHLRDDDLNLSLDRTTRYVADRLKIAGSDWVLDAGCGVGGSALQFARDRGARVIGVTLERGQAVLGRAYAMMYGLESLVQIVEGDFMALDYAPDSFDVVVNIESLCYAHDVTAYLRQMYGLLRPGGRFGCVDVFRGSGGDERARDAMIEGCVLAKLHTQPDLAAEIRSAGFVDVESEDLTDRVRGSAEVLRARTGYQLAVMAVERALVGERESPTYQAHVRGGMGAAVGILSGSVRYGYVGGVKPGHA